MTQPTTSEITILQNQTLTLLVEDIKENVKCFPTKSGLMKCRHDVYCRDKQGNRSVFEYVTPMGAPIMFYINVWQQVRCVYANEKGATVEPVIDGAHPGLIESSKTTQSKDSNNKKVGGAAYTFALGFAKDLFAAVVRRAEIGTQISGENIGSVIQIADEILSLMTLRVGVEGDHVNHYESQIGGSSYLFALGFAKDLMCAEIAIRDIGSTISAEDIERMFQWADKFQNNMSDRFSF